MMETRWLTSSQAAEYCGYSVKSFRKMVKKYQVPRYGPKRNRYDRWDLDTWMQDPNVFLRKSYVSPWRRRVPGEFTPV